MGETKRQRLRAETRGPTIVCSPGDALLQNVPVPVVFFFEERLDTGMLLTSLRAALTHYPIFNASLCIEGDRLLLHCDDNGVSVSVVERDRTYSEVVDDLLEEEGSRLVELLDPRRTLRKRDPVLSVRISHFRGGGSALGICWHHSVGDMATFMMFMMAWTKSAAGEDHVAPIIAEDRHAYLCEHVPDDGRAIDSLRFLGLRDLFRLGAYMAFEARRKRRIAFFFDDEEVAEMRRCMEEETGARLSNNDALCGHITTVISDADEVRRDRLLAIAVNWRPRIGLPDNVLGNYVGGLLVPSEAGAMPAALAGRVRSAVNVAAEEHMDLHSGARFFAEHGGVPKAWRVVPRGLDPVNGNLLITNWSRFGVYDVMFGGARPELFMAIGETPFPWLSGLVEGPNKRGHVFFGELPTSVFRKLERKEARERIHRHRPTRSSAAAIPWLA